MIEPSGWCAANPFQGLNAIPSSTAWRNVSLQLSCSGTSSRATVT
jgi:hypothetical protein